MIITIKNPYLINYIVNTKNIIMLGGIMHDPFYPSRYYFNINGNDIDYYYGNSLDEDGTEEENKKEQIKTKKLINADYNKIKKAMLNEGK